MSDAIEDLPTTAQQWRERAIKHYAESRAMMARFEELSKPITGHAVVAEVSAISPNADRAYRIAANETQAAIACGIIADAMINETLTTPYEYGTEYPL